MDQINHSFTPSDFWDTGIRKLGCVAKTQFLHGELSFLNWKSKLGVFLNSEMGFF